MHYYQKKPKKQMRYRWVFIFFCLSAPLLNRAQTQSIEVSGTITDHQGAILEGVSVLSKQSKRGSSPQNGYDPLWRL